MCMRQRRYGLLYYRRCGGERSCSISRLHYYKSESIFAFSVLTGRIYHPGVSEPFIAKITSTDRINRVNYESMRRDI